MNKKITYLSLIVLLLAVFSTVYFAWIRPKKVEKSDAFSIPKAQKEELVGEFVQGFPPIPVYPDAELEYSYVKSEANKRGYEAEWTTQDAVNEVAEWYIDALSSIGWSLEMSDEVIKSDLGEIQIVAEKGINILYLTIEDEDRIQTEIYAEFPVREY